MLKYTCRLFISSCIACCYIPADCVYPPVLHAAIYLQIVFIPLYCMLLYTCRLFISPCIACWCIPADCLYPPVLHAAIYLQIVYIPLYCMLMKNSVCCLAERTIPFRYSTLRYWTIIRIERSSIEFTERSSIAFIERSRIEFTESSRIEFLEGQE